MLFKRLYNFLTVFVVTSLVFSCNTDSLHTTPVKPVDNKIKNKETKNFFSIKGNQEKQTKITKKNKNVEIGLDSTFDKKPFEIRESKNSNGKGFSIKALTDTQFYPKDIGVDVDFDVYADYYQDWIIYIVGPTQTVCNASLRQRIWSTGPVGFTLYLPETFTITGEYKVYIGDRDANMNMINPVLLGTLNVKNPQGLTLNKTFESDYIIQYAFTNKTGDIFQYQLTGSSPGSGSCFYYKDGTLTFAKPFLSPGDYKLKLSLMQYPDIYAEQSFNIPFPEISDEPYITDNEYYPYGQNVNYNKMTFTTKSVDNSCQ